MILIYNLKVRINGRDGKQFEADFESKSNSEDCYDVVERVVLVSDTHPPISRAVPVTVCLNRKLSFQTTLLLLHDLHSDEVLEVWIVSLKSIAYVLVRLRDPRCYMTTTTIEPRGETSLSCKIRTDLQTVLWSYGLLSKCLRQILRTTLSCSWPTSCE